tara:strand:- start:259760 stop:260740 length:981 start_codon:yes stop_codon:yes gene_type:complete
MNIHSDPSTAPNGVLLAINSRGEDLSDPYGTPPSDTWTWLHLAQKDTNAREWILNKSGIPTTEAQALIADHARPRCIQTETGLLFVGRGINLDKGSVPEDMKSIRVWIEKDRIITVIKRRMRSAEAIAEQFNTDHPPSSPASVLVQLFSQMIQYIAPLVQEIGDALEDIQFSVIDDEIPTPEVTELSRIRLRTVALHRYLLPLYEAAVTLSTAKQLTGSGSALTQATLTRDQLGRIVEELAAIEAKAAVTRDEMVSQRSEQLNNRVYRLTVMAAIFLPLTVFTGMLGMNVGGIPLASNTIGFLVTTLIMLACMGLTIVVLRLIRWL